MRSLWVRSVWARSLYRREVCEWESCGWESGGSEVCGWEIWKKSRKLAVASWVQHSDFFTWTPPKAPGAFWSSLGSRWSRAQSLPGPSLCDSLAQDLLSLCAVQLMPAETCRSCWATKTRWWKKRSGQASYLMRLKLYRVTIFFGSDVLQLATEEYMLFGWNSCARCLTRTLGSIELFLPQVNTV